MTLINSKLKTKAIFFTTIIGILSNVKALELNLTHEPLYLNQSVPPALAITFDDSGSMAWGFMPSGRSYSGNGRSTASSDYNEIYYDPTIEYKPPVRSDGTSFPDSNYYAAQFDGFYQGGNTATRLGRLVNLSNNYQLVWTSYPNYATGNTGWSFLNAARPATNEGYYYTWNGPGNPTRDGAAGTGAGQYTLHTMNSATAVEQQNFANWYTYYKTRGILAKTAVSHSFVNFGPDFKIDWQQLNSLSYVPSGANMDLFAGTHREDFYDWLYSIPAGGGTPLRLATQRAGALFEQGSSADTNSPYYDANYGSELSCQQNFHIAISDGGWNSSNGFATNADNTNRVLPAIEPAGVNLSYTYNASTLPSSMYAANQSNTLADKAFHFWSRDLRGDLINQVPSYIEDFTDRNGNTVVVPDGQQWWQQSELFWNPLNDPATWQHMVNYNIGLGVFGALDPTTSLAGIRNGTITWPGTGSNSGLIDDVWHASLNSRGKFFSAKDPAELATALNQVVSNIITRKGRASAGTVSSNVISSASLSYKTTFDTADWSGGVLASTLNSDGSIGAVQGDAGCKLTGGVCAATGTTVSATNTPSSRNIFTFANGIKSDFEVSGLSQAAINNILSNQFIQDNITSVSPTDVINYIRGDRTLEIQNGGVFRDRRTILGDVIHSQAKIIRGPNASYDDDIWPDLTPERIAADSGNGYQDFRDANRNRNSILLVGANDGMLHAFDAGINNFSNGGHEFWAYVPSSSFENMAELVNPAYQHKSFVDSAPFVRDAFINGSWNTIAVGNLRHGGKLFYALNLGLNPENEPNVLWEFGNNEDSDMGYTYSGAVISRVYNPYTNQSTWVAFLPNGYNSDNHNAVLYAIDLSNGTLLHKWTTNGGSLANPNGMGPPVATDYVAYDPLDPSIESYAADQSTDFIYAGDLHGNIYKFNTLDIFSGATVSSPEVLFNGSSDQPITTPPRVFTPSDSTEDIIVTFGTGKYIETPDRDTATTPTQYIIGLRDTKNSYATYDLTDSRIINQTITETGNLRNLSNNAVSRQQSWKIELPSQGERMVNVMGRNNRQKLLLASTIIPTGIDPCLPGGQSWIIGINAINGSGKSIFKDAGNPNADGVYVNGLALGVNLLTTPGGDNSFINIDTTGTSNGTNDSVTADIEEKSWGRKSWHRIILD